MVDKPDLTNQDSLPTLVQIEMDQFIELLKVDDKKTTSMLRVHLVTENLLERASIANLPGSSSLIENSNLTYQNKLEIFNSFQKADSSLIGSLRQLNKVRNAASHVQDSSVGRSEVEKIGRPLGKEYVDLRKKFSANLDRFAIAVLGLVFARLMDAVHKIEDSGD